MIQKSLKTNAFSLPLSKTSTRLTHVSGELRLHPLRPHAQTSRFFKDFLNYEECLENTTWQRLPWELINHWSAVLYQNSEGIPSLIPALARQSINLDWSILTYFQCFRLLGTWTGSQIFAFEGMKSKVYSTLTHHLKQNQFKLVNIELVNNKTLRDKLRALKILEKK